MQNPLSLHSNTAKHVYLGIENINISFILHLCLSFNVQLLILRRVLKYGKTTKTLEGVQKQRCHRFGAPKTAHVNVDMSLV